MPAERSHDSGDAFREDCLTMLSRFGFRCRGTKIPIKCSMQDLHEINTHHTVDIIVEYDERNLKLLCPIESKREIPGTQTALVDIATKLANEAQCITMDDTLSNFSHYYTHVKHAIIMTETDLGDRRILRFKRIADELYFNRSIEVDIICGSRLRIIRAAARHIEDNWTDIDDGAITFDIHDKSYSKSLPLNPLRLTNTRVNYFVKKIDDSGEVAVFDMSGLYTLDAWNRDLAIVNEKKMKIVAVHSIGAFSGDLLQKASSVNPSIPFVDHNQRFCHFERYFDYYLIT